MSDFISCFACDKEPTQQCPRCGRPYCDDHGEELCDACLEPASGVPSFTLYRGSLLALLVGTALAVWLLVQPGSSDGEINRPTVVPTQAIAAGNGTNTVPQTSGTTVPNTNPTTTGAATQSAGTQAAGPTATRPATTTTPTTGTTPGAGGGTTYTVVSGDNGLGVVCEKVKPASMSVADCIDQIVTLNGLSSADAPINIGQILRVPAR